MELYACAGLHTKYIRILKILLMELGFVYMHERNALSGEKNKGYSSDQDTEKNLCAHARKNKDKSVICVSRTAPDAQSDLPEGRGAMQQQTKNTIYIPGARGGCWLIPLPGAEMSIHSHPSLLQTDILSRSMGSAVSLPFTFLSNV